MVSIEKVCEVEGSFKIGCYHRIRLLNLINSVLILGSLNIKTRKYASRVVLSNDDVRKPDGNMTETFQ